MISITITNVPFVKCYVNVMTGIVNDFVEVTDIESGYHAHRRDDGNTITITYGAVNDLW